jgi:hypothetical protein
MASQFVHFHFPTRFSLLDSANLIEPLVERMSLRSCKHFATHGGIWFIWFSGLSRVFGFSGFFGFAQREIR